MVKEKEVTKMKNAIETKWECSSCGNVVNKGQVLMTNLGLTKYSFVPPEKCQCSSKTFNLMEFKQANSIIVNDEKLKKIEQYL